MPSSIFTSVASKGHGVGVFTDPEKITVFPEFNYLKSPSGCSKFVVNMDILFIDDFLLHIVEITWEPKLKACPIYVTLFIQLEIYNTCSVSMKQ